jgi:transposase
MNFNTQNGRIAALKDDWMIVGVDVGCDKHFARAFNNRKMELSKKPFCFENTEEGFASFKIWLTDLMVRNHMNHVMVGMEPTGHYWFNLANYIKENSMTLCHVNPAHVKKSKELDDTNPSKNDRKDPKVIAGLVCDGRYALPYMPEGIYAEMRGLNNLNYRETEEMIRKKNRYARWICIFFPELKKTFADAEDSATIRAVLKEAPLPEDVLKLGVDGINAIFRKNKMRGAGMKQAKKLYEAAEHSIGHASSPSVARMEIKAILEDIETHENRLRELDDLMEQTLRKIPNVDKLFEIRGIGLKTISGFIAEIGDVSRFEDPKAIQKLAGLAIVDDQSGKHNGKTTISYRGRKHLRYVMYKGAISILMHNSEFAAIYTYYTTRPNNPLKKLQAVIAIACKMIRVFYTILTKGVRYDSRKLTADILRTVPQLV